MTDQSPQAQIDLIYKAFEQDFERFFPYIKNPTALGLEQALAEQRAVGELRTRHLGKKSALAWNAAASACSFVAGRALDAVKNTRLPPKQYQCKA